MPKILLVDDDENLLNSLGDFFEIATGVNCLRFQGLAELITRKTESYASECILAILDINLGAGQPSGIDVYHWLLKHDFGGKIVFLTGHAKDHPLVREATELGETKVFAKPMDIESLVALVEDRANGQLKVG